MAFLSYGLLNSGVRVILLINYMAFLLLGYKAGNPKFDLDTHYNPLKYASNLDLKLNLKKR